MTTFRTALHSLPVKVLTDTARCPTRSNRDDAGLDLYADEGAVIYPHQPTLVSTGVAVSIPRGYVGLIWPRSGLATKKGIHRTAGVIDAGYTGEVKVALVSLSETETVAAGDRIAQLLIQPVEIVDPVIVRDLPGAERGADGFGSTGR